MAKELSKNIHVVGDTVMFFSAGNNVPTHSQVKISEGDSLTGNRWLNWGDNNLYPQEFGEKLKRTGVAIGGLEVLTAAHFGTGFSIFQAVETDGIIQFKERTINADPRIATFYLNCNFNIFLSEIIEDFEHWRFAVPEYLLSPNGEQIISVRRHKAADCRFEKPDKQGIIWNIGVNTDWANYKEEYTTVIPCFASHIPINEIKEHCKKKGIRRFTIPIVDTLLFEKTYPSVGWHSSFKNGWVDVVLAIPAFKKAMFSKQLNVKHIIHIADDYFSHIYKEQWKDFTPAEKQKIRTDLVDLIDNKLKGNDAAGSSIISPYFRDQNSGELIKGIQMDALPQPQANGDFLTDSSAANYELLVAMGLDPAVVTGGTFGGKALSGSGSDKREAWTILCAKMPKKQIRTLQIFENIKYWNGWDPTFFGKYPNVNLTTLDNNKDGQQKIVN